MSKRRRAPGELERVRAFVNTRQIGHGSDRIADPAGLAAWLVDQGLAPAGLRVTPADLAQAHELREALRAVLAAHTHGEPPPGHACGVLDAVAQRGELTLRFDGAGGASLVPEAAGCSGALARLLAVVHDSIAQGTWVRLKACRDHGCEWAFYDHTKNRSGAWCSMEVCGNRAKARVYRERHAGAMDTQ